ncbi:Ger(x)C family spore germination protein [Neobacillus sp. PS3-12]|uniref:Ger(x)C family spore germination protein n=1 Tax=Neobacillus sp. PS3-12 TaxID=3070677 RepID=UPI0027E008A8|nr:Ger(x)C family spore germination protein [Neobacillus sp. PS3-12]WML55846.1 Ger(x)C family spore germination protein [Neobacillus sp. PS3-12]
MIKAKPAYFLICMLSFLLVGCWDRIEVNDLALVMATGLDKTSDQKLQVTAQIATPSQGGQSAASSSNQLPYLVVSTIGTNTISAKQKMQEELSRRIYMPHRRVLIIGEDLAKQGFQPILDQLTREPSSRLDTFVLIAKGTTANALMKVPYPYEGVPMEAVREIERSKLGPTVTLKDLVNVISSGTMSPLLPAIEMESQSNGHSTFRINGTAIFRHDRLIGWLDDRKTRGLMWLRKDVKQAFMTIKLNQTPGYISMNLNNYATKIFTKKEKGQLVIHFTVLADGDIVENSTDIDLMDPKNDTRLNKIFSDELNKRITSSLYTIQHRYQTDVLEIGEILHQQKPKEWKKLSAHWDQEFPKVKFVIQTKVKTNHIGMTGKLN